MADTLMPAIVEAPPVEERRRPPRVRKTPMTYVLRFIATAYLFFLVAWPVSLVVTRTFDGGFASIQSLLDDPDTVVALQLSAYVAVFSVVINTLFGVGISMLLVRQQFPKARLIVLGSGRPEKFADLMDRYGVDDVEFKGFVSLEDKARYYASADVCCVPLMALINFQSNRHPHKKRRRHRPPRPRVIKARRSCHPGIRCRDARSCVSMHLAAGAAYDTIPVVISARERIFCKIHFFALFISVCLRFSPC